MYAYFSQWVAYFSGKIHLLIQVRMFPLSDSAIRSFQNLKRDIANSTIAAINPSAPLVVETDTSDSAISASLRKHGWAVAFFSRTLLRSERRHTAIEKEAYAIVKALRKWRHYLIGRHFHLITDQKSVSFIFNPKTSSKIKNEKIASWRMELYCYSFDVCYRPGKEKASVDALSRVGGLTTSSSNLQSIHRELCHPGITRMTHVVRSRNLPYSDEDVKRITNSRQICAENKPRFYKPPQVTLEKTTQPFERLKLDFKGPLPSKTQNKYMVTINDEYSTFPFVIPCSNVTATTVIQGLCNSKFSECLSTFIQIGELPLCQKISRVFLHERGLAVSRTSPYNPQRNGLCQRYNGIIWKTVQLALANRKMLISKWESIIPEALNAIRTLLCTSTNATPEMLIK